jgi:hypothetical protein
MPLYELDWANIEVSPVNRNRFSGGFKALA